MSPLAVGVAGIAVVLTVVALDRLALRIVRPGRRPIDRTVAELGVEHEDLAILSGRHELAAWLLCPADAHPDEPVVLVAHGWGANYGIVLELAEPLAERGHDVLLFDIRGHGRNPRLPFVTVRHFRDDVMAMSRYARKRFPGRRVVLVGHSMGGAAGVVAAADGAPIDGLVLIAAPADVLRVTAEYLSDHGMPGTFLVRLLRPFFWRRIGGTFLPLTPTRRIAELDIPILMIQPELDRRVVRRHADRLAAAAGIDYHLVEGRGHTDVLSAPETLRLIEDFLQRVSP